MSLPGSNPKVASISLRQRDLPRKGQVERQHCVNGIFLERAKLNVSIPDPVDLSLSNWRPAPLNSQSRHAPVNLPRGDSKGTASPWLARSVDGNCLGKIRRSFKERTCAYCECGFRAPEVNSVFTLCGTSPRDKNIQTISLLNWY